MGFCPTIPPSRIVYAPAAAQLGRAARAKVFQRVDRLNLPSGTMEVGTFRGTFVMMAFVERKTEKRMVSSWSKNLRRCAVERNHNLLQSEPEFTYGAGSSQNSRNIHVERRKKHFSLFDHATGR